MNVEHDVQFDDALVDDLLACPHPLCAHAYKIHTPREFIAYNASDVGWHPPIDSLSRYTARGFHWLEPGEEWADFGSIGFCKITPEARFGALRKDGWTHVEHSVNAAVCERWHVHWRDGESGPTGIEHYHR